MASAFHHPVRDRIKLLLPSNMTCGEISIQLNCNPDYVRYIAREEGRRAIDLEQQKLQREIRIQEQAKAKEEKAEKKESKKEAVKKEAKEKKPKKEK